MEFGEINFWIISLSIVNSICSPRVGGGRMLLSPFTLIVEELSIRSTLLIHLETVVPHLTNTRNRSHQFRQSYGRAEEKPLIITGLGGKRSSGYSENISDSEDEARHRGARAIGDRAALPESLAKAARRGRGCPVESSDGEGRVEVLPDLGDYPIRDGPGVDPGEGSESALGEDGGTEGLDGEGHEIEGGVFAGGGSSGGAGEQSHHILAGGWAMEPPLDVRGQEALHRVDVTGAQGLIQGEHHPFVIRFFLQADRADGVSQFWPEFAVIERKEAQPRKR
ncbi:hypothetical protein H6P81_008074 [Aristolochia fimbriata]|uniref:Uncharacterized protein n=1 Tax=Aristolochia fimbriata TaxID=158543 RepID=A0AAV7F4C0_ARIFI|nr:hypothetical protein H6P81_008074 [Aristolochia fimbriata]